MNSTLQRSAIDLGPLLDAVARELDLYRIDNQSRAGLRETAIALAEELGALPCLDMPLPALSRVHEIARGIWSSGYLSQPVSRDDLSLASELASAGRAGLLGAMLFVPCWQWTEAPELDAVPEWLWGEYVAWVFAPPCTATAPGGADAHLRKLEALAVAICSWASRNLGASCVKAAAEAFERHRDETSPLRSTLPLRRWASASAGIFARIHRCNSRTTSSPFAFPRATDPLRIGVLLPDWGESIGVRALLPRLSSLNRAAFEIHLFAERLRHDPLEKTCREFAAKLQVLPAPPAERIKALHAAGLDVLVFGGPLSDAALRLVALDRYAPLQVVTDACPITTGLPEIDLHLSGIDADPAEFTESVGLLPAPGFVWDADTAPAVFPKLTRADLGLPATGPVIASSPQLEHLSPETLQAWAALLQANPASSLLLLLPPDSDTFALEQIFNRLQAAAGLDSSRCILSLGDPRAALSHADIYLDTYPYSAPTSLLVALAAGRPAVAWEGKSHRARTGAAVLRTIGQSAWVAGDSAGYVERAQRLIQDASLRLEVQSSVQQAIESQLGLFDAPVASQHFGDLIRNAFDLLAKGRRLPRLLALPRPGLTASALADLASEALARRDPDAAIAHASACLRVAPESAAARSLLGRAHLLAGRSGLAVSCFFSALRGRENEAQAWLDLGAGFRAQKEMGNAIKAYTAALRIDRETFDGWLALSEVARESGADDLAESALDVARRIAPHDPRLAASAL